MILLAGLANGHKIVDTIDLPDSDYWKAILIDPFLFLPGSSGLVRIFGVRRAFLMVGCFHAVLQGFS